MKHKGVARFAKDSDPKSWLPRIFFLNQECLNRRQPKIGDFERYPFCGLSFSKTTTQTLYFKSSYELIEL